MCFIKEYYLYYIIKEITVLFLWRHRTQMFISRIKWLEYWPTVTESPRPKMNAYYSERSAMFPLQLVFFSVGTKTTYSTLASYLQPWWVAKCISTFTYTLVCSLKIDIRGGRSQFLDKAAYFRKVRFRYATKGTQAFTTRLQYYDHVSLWLSWLSRLRK